MCIRDRGDPVLVKLLPKERTVLFEDDKKGIRSGDLVSGIVAVSYTHLHPVVHEQLVPDHRPVCDVTTLPFFIELLDALSLIHI